MLTACEVYEAGELRRLSVGEYDAEGRWHDWFFQPAHFEHIENLTGDSVEKLSSYLVSYCTKTGKSLLPDPAGKAVDLAKQVSADLGNLEEVGVDREGLYCRRLLASVGLRMKAALLSVALAVSVPFIGLDCISLPLMMISAVAGIFSSAGSHPGWACTVF